MTRLIVLSALAGLLLSPGAASAAPGHPVVRMQGAQPLRLSGEGFRSGERVVVTVEFGSATHIRKVVASASGRFSALFAPVRVTRCGPDLTVKAVGGSGSRIEFTLHQLACRS